MTLTEFLLARIAEDEAVAREVVSRYDPGFFAAIDAESTMLWASPKDPAVSADPARVLAECAAKRRIVDAYVFAERRVHDGPSPVGPEWNLGFRQATWGAICLLALPYVGHEDCRDEWKP
jgi:hypothetical protein